MKALLLSVLLAVAASAQYAGPKTVYILPMAAGLDQYLAQWLTRDHVMQVVTDPKAAEVIMTDALGEPFEQKLKQILPSDTSKESNDSSHSTFRTSRGRGTIFIVDAKSRQVLWSDHQKPPRSNSDHDLNRAAELIAKKLVGPKGSGN